MRVRVYEPVFSPSKQFKEAANKRWLPQCAVLQYGRPSI